MSPEQAQDLRNNLRYVVEHLPSDVLLAIADEVLDTLNFRIDMAPSTAKPVFFGIAALYDATRAARR